jgi:hypothetical protein
VKLLQNIYERLIAPHENTLTDSDIDGLRRLCYDKKYAHMTTDYNLLKEGYRPNCSVSMIPRALFFGFIAIVIEKKSPYLGLFNYKYVSLKPIVSSSTVLQD